MSKFIVTAQSGKTVNLRLTPSQTSSIILAVPIGTEVELVEKSSDEWYKIKYKEAEGYMMSKFLKGSSISQDDLHKVYNSLCETLTLIEKILK